MSETIIALYDTLDDANEAVADLVDEGFNRSDIGLIVNDAEGQYRNNLSGTTNTNDMDVVEGAVVGALAGGSITALAVGLAALTIPGIGPIVAAGPIAAAMGGVAGAGIGAAAASGDFTASMIDLGVPESQVDFYGEAIRRGSTMVTVIAEETRITEAMRVLNRHNPFDVEHRAHEWGDSQRAAAAASNDNRVRRYTPNTPR